MDISSNRTHPAWAAHLMSELQLADGRAERVARGLSREQLNWGPAPGAWGIGQCLDHLRIANELYLPAIAKALDGSEQSPAQEAKLSLFMRWFIRNYIGPEMRTRAKSPTKAQPAAAVEVSVVDAFLRSNKLAREVISRASAYDVNRIRFTNPFVPIFRFTVGAGLEIVSQHECRHLLQAERVRESGGFPPD